jgi:hypothetical protein
VPGSESTSKSSYKPLKELTSLIRKAKRESYPGVPYLTESIEVEDEVGLASIDPEGMDWLELSLLVMNKHVVIPTKTQLILLGYGIVIPEEQEMH